MPRNPLAEAIIEFESTLSLRGGDVEVPEKRWDHFVALARQAVGDAAPAPKPYRLGVIACSAAKARFIRGEGNVLAPARQVYTGETFKLALAAAERHCDAVVILSAKYEVLTPDQRIEWYDQRIPVEKGALARWQRYVGRKLHDILKRTGEAKPRCLMLAPQSYARGICVRGEPYPNGFDPVVVEPLKGMGIGHQKAWLAKVLAGEVQP